MEDAIPRDIYGRCMQSQDGAKNILAANKAEQIGYRLFVISMAFHQGRL